MEIFHSNSFSDPSFHVKKKIAYFKPVLSMTISLCNRIFQDSEN